MAIPRVWILGNRVPNFTVVEYRRSKLMKPVLAAATLAMGLGLAVPAMAQANDPGRTSPLAQTDPGKESTLARPPRKGSTLAQATPRDAGKESPLVAQATPRDAGRESPLVAQAAPRDAGRESPLVAQAAPRDVGRESPFASADEALSPQAGGKG